MANKTTQKLRIKLTLQNITKEKKLPTFAQFKKWVRTVLVYSNLSETVELTIRLIDRGESAALNSQYRHKAGPTNILSFPATIENTAEMSHKTHTRYLGDLAICIPLVSEEAQAQNKIFLAHLAHLVIHGTLHCLGYTHDKRGATCKMEKTEIEIMRQLGYENPY